MAKARPKVFQPMLFSPTQLHPITELEAARTSALVCRKCRLCETRDKVVFGKGNIKEPPIFFVGEGPGAQENLIGEPFAGRAGQKLDEILASVGIERSACYISNVVKCRPPENRKPLNDEVAACLEYLVKELRVIRPRTIVLLGATAAETVLGKTGSLSSLRGTWFSWEGIPVRVTYHPAYLLRSPNDTKEVVADLRLVKAKAHAEAQ